MGYQLAYNQVLNEQYAYTYNQEPISAARCLAALAGSCFYSLTEVGISHCHVLQEANVVHKIKQPGKMSDNIIGSLLARSDQFM